MPSIVDVYGNVPTLKRGYKRVMGLGEGLVTDEFIMSFPGDNNIRYLVQATQLPALQREIAETYGPQGVQFKQMTRYKNAQDVPITFKETIKGHAYAFLVDHIKHKKYIDILLSAAGESFLDGNPHTSIKLEDSWIEIDGLDLNVEDGATLARPSGTIHANWVTWCDDGSRGNGLSLSNLP